MKENSFPTGKAQPNPNAQRVLTIFLTGLVVVLAVWAGISYVRVLEYRRLLQNSYLRAVEDAAVNLSNISTDLVKGMYAASPGQLSSLSARLWKEAASAKASLEALPAARLHLDNTYHFLSQVGDYAMYLSRQSATGQTITQQEHRQFQNLREYADRLNQQIAQLEQQLSTGEVTFAQMEKLALTREKGKISSQNTTSQLDAMEQGFTGYPTLIYDGPFSDHILEKEPQAVIGLPEVTALQAKETALAAVDGQDLPNQREENSHLPCYVFYSDEHSVAVTKQGGLLCYVTGPKPQEIRPLLTAEEALHSAKEYLKQQGFSQMSETYYEIHNGIMTINFAYQHPQPQAICYTDLVKVDVSMEDGEILSFDARGYLVNHRQRDLAVPHLTRTEAQKHLSPTLSVDHCQLALIPTSGQNEVLAYEFHCTGSAGDQVLVYINGENGHEEQILLLLQNKNGTLTR